MGKVEKIFIYTFSSFMILIISFVILLILHKGYMEKLITGQELWIVMVISMGLTYLCDAEEESKKSN